MGAVTPPDYPTLFFFEVGQWWDYAMLLLVIALLAGGAWLAQRNMWVVLALFVVVPIALTIFWWPHSTAGTASAGWFPIVKQYSALAGSLCLVALQVFPRLRHNRWYLIIPPAILAVNIAEAVVRDFQCYGIHGVDPSQGMVTWGGPWNIMNGIAGILNLLAISGWVGIFVSKGKERALVWGDLTIGWIIAYDLWNFAYVYNCLADRAWYSGVALLAACTIPALMTFGRGAWIQYRAYTLTLWSAVVLTFPHFMHDSMFAHRSSHNPWALLIVSAVALIANVWMFVAHVRVIVTKRRNPFTQEVHADEATYTSWVRDLASDEDKELIAARLGTTPQEAGFVAAVSRYVSYLGTFVWEGSYLSPGGLLRGGGRARLGCAAPTFCTACDAFRLPWALPLSAKSACGLSRNGFTHAREPAIRSTNPLVRTSTRCSVRGQPRPGPNKRVYVRIRRPGSQ